jgi:hypothetical protein
MEMRVETVCHSSRTKGGISEMVMGYFDESANPQADFICMSGYLADDTNWEALTGDWNQLLRKYEIPYMHLADFIASKNVYEELGWKDRTKSDQINQALDDFIMVIRRHTLAGIGVGLAAKKYREIMKGVRKKEKPEVFCFERALRLVMDRMKKWNWEESICLIFDDSRDYSMKAYANLWEVKDRNPEVKQRVAGIAFGNDEKFAPLQAADFLAYATARANRLGDSAWFEHPQFKNLMLDENPAYGKLHDSEYWDDEVIERNKDNLIAIGNRQGFVI